MTENKVTIRVVNNGFVVELSKDHAPAEVWVYTDAAAAALCAQGLLEDSKKEAAK